MGMRRRVDPNEIVLQEYTSFLADIPKSEVFVLNTRLTNVDVRVCGNEEKSSRSCNGRLHESKGGAYKPR